MEEWKRGVNTLDKDHAKGEMNKGNNTALHTERSNNPGLVIFISSITYIIKCITFSNPLTLNIECSLCFHTIFTY